MDVELVTRGPVTTLVDSRAREFVGTLDRCAVECSDELELRRTDYSGGYRNGFQPMPSICRGW